MFFPNGQYMIDVIIVQDGYLLDIVIINNKTTIYDMPAAQLLDLLLEHDDFF